MEKALFTLLETCIAAPKQPEYGEESERSSKKWQELKESVEAAFSQKNDEIKSLQRELEIAQSESRSARGHVEGLQNELKEVKQSLVELKQSHSQEEDSASAHSGAETKHELEPNGNQNAGIKSKISHNVEMGPDTISDQGLEPSTSVSTNQDEHTEMVTNGSGGMESSQTQHVETGALESDQGLSDDGEYQRVDHALLYYHKATGYYYDPATQQFYAPASYPQSSSQQQLGEATQSASSDGLGSGQTSDIASMLAAASDQVTERCGYAYDESTGMYYDSQYGLYYDQDSQLYYDAEAGTYYSYDPEARQYQFHSRVKLPPKKVEPESDSGDSDVINLCSSEEEIEDSPEEGEIRPPKRPKLPHGPPPPEEEWAPALRMVVTSSDVLPEQTLFVVTQEGASIGREPVGPNGIKIPELLISKNHAEISYNKRRKHFMIKDLGSRNGTLLNQERLSEPKETSPPFTLSHQHTLTLGTTFLSIHIHAGWEVCEGCLCDSTHKEDDPRGVARGQGQSLDLQRRREMNRIKKKFGLRAKDTYGEKEAGPAEGYTDRATTRRKAVGSDAPPSRRPDDPPSSVHRPISEGNKGRRMLEKMGWSKGRGLGRQGTGMAEPVMAEVRDEKAGLGTAFSKRGLEAVDKQSSSQKHQRMLRHFSQVVSREHKHQQHLNQDMFTD